MSPKFVWKMIPVRIVRCAVFTLCGLVTYTFLDTQNASGQVVTQIKETSGTGDIGTRIIPSGNTYNIVHGTPSGNNLFHSFSELSLASGDIARFQTVALTPDATVQNILGRVTGGSSSHLLGTIDSATFYPQASLFLMNPNGIVLGPTATLNVGGSVTFTTAHYMRLAEANGSQPGIFSANPTQSNILTSAPVSAFGFMNTSVSSIKPLIIEGSILSVPVEQSLSLVGGTISISSGSVINAPSGQIRLASTISDAEIYAHSLQNTPNLNNDSLSTAGNITITSSTLDVNGSTNIGNGSGGTIVIRGGRLVLDAGIVSANTLGDVAGAQTAVDIKLTGDIHLQNASSISASASSAGNGGNISIRSQTLTLRDGSSLSTFSAGEGASGNLSVETVDSIQISGLDPQFGNGSSLQTTTGNAPGGNVWVKAGHLTIGASGSISTTAVGTKRAGNLRFEIDGSMTILDGGAVFSNGSNGSGIISVKANELTVQNHAGPDLRSRIESIGGDGETGNIDIKVKRFLLSDDARVNMEGAGKLGQIKIAADDLLSVTNGGKIRMENAGTGLTGLIELESPKITLNQGIIQTLTVGPGDAAPVNLTATDILFDGGKIDSSTCFSTCGATGGAGGAVSLSATESVTIRGQFAERILGGQNDPASPAGIFSATGNSGNSAGNITLSAQTIDISDGARISSQTSGPGDAGNILINTNNIALTRGATITAASTGTGNAGNITIQGPHSPANTVSIDGIESGIFTSTENTGAGGDILLTARQSIFMNNGALISATSAGTGNAGNILIDAGQEFQMQNGSITTQALQASGGNIDIKAVDLIRVTNGLISSSVQGGPSTAGGNITIDPKTVVLQGSTHILASAQQGSGGNIEITTPLFLKDPTSIVDASSRFGLSGTVTIQSPTSNLSGTVGQLASKTSPPQVLVENRCVALAGGEQSTFILAGRDARPSEPGGWLSSPIAMEHWTGEGTADHASGLLVQRKSSSRVQVMAALRNDTAVLSLRRLTPPGFLVRTFATGTTGCPS